MSVDAMTADSIPKEKSHVAFFRQSGWLMIANVAGGMLMWAVHLLSKKIPEAEYGVFGTLLAVIMVVPAIPLQMVFAQQTAKALATNRTGELSGMIRLIWLGTTVIWVVVAAVALLMQGWIVEQWKLGSPLGLWVLLPALLFSLWMPIFGGVLQGAQNFLWLGWSMILNAVGRSLIAATLVLFVVGSAVSLMTGVVAGMLASGLIVIWQSRSFWSAPTASFDWRNLLKQVLPLMIGFTAFQFLFTADTMFVKAYFSKDETAFYVSAGTLSRALMWLVMPLATVMFPRLVHSAAKSEKSNLMGLVLLGTAVLAVCGAIGLTVLGPFVVKFVFKPSYVEVATQVLPWYAFAMVPIALTNVLLNDLLARGVYRVVLPLVILVVGYAVALTQFHESLIMVLQTLGTFGLGALAVCGWFSWRSPQTVGQSSEA